MTTICNFKKLFSFLPATIENQKSVVTESNMKGNQITAIKAAENFFNMVINCYIAYFRTGHSTLWCSYNLPVCLAIKMKFIACKQDLSNFYQRTRARSPYAVLNVIIFV